MLSLKTITLIRLATTNAIGFAASTVVPLWIGAISAEMGMPLWYAGAMATLQLVAAASLNFLTPVFFRQFPPLVLARLALLVAAVASLLQQWGDPVVFSLASLVCGGALGVVLNTTNRILAKSQEVQKGYAVFQLTEVCFGAGLFGVCAFFANYFGLTGIFGVVGVVCLIGLLLLRKIPIETLDLIPENTIRTTSNHMISVLGLGALFLFFVGQSSINSFMVPIGQNMGIDISVISTIIPMGMLFGFGGALLARLIGERYGMVVPVMLVAISFMMVFSFVTRTSSLPVYAISAACLAFGTMFAVPYFFTMLAKLDRGGLYASIGPAFLLAGVAVGPSVAVNVNAVLGLPALGLVAAFFVILGSGLFFICTLVYGKKDVSTVKP